MMLVYLITSNCFSLYYFMLHKAVIIFECWVRVCHYKTRKKEGRYQIIQLTHFYPVSIRGPRYSKENFLSTRWMRSMFPMVNIRGKYLLLAIFP